MKFWRASQDESPKFLGKCPYLSLTPAVTLWPSPKREWVNNLLATTKSRWFWPNVIDVILCVSYSQLKTKSFSPFCRRFLERGILADFCQLKQFYERKEIVVDWFKKNDWLHALLGDYCTRSLRPAHMSADVSPSHLPADPISFSVQRWVSVWYNRLSSPVIRSPVDLSGGQDFKSPFQALFVMRRVLLWKWRLWLWPNLPVEFWGAYPSTVRDNIRKGLLCSAPLSLISMLIFVWSLSVSARHR